MKIITKKKLFRELNRRGKKETVMHILKLKIHKIIDYKRMIQQHIHIRSNIMGENLYFDKLK